MGEHTRVGCDRGSIPRLNAVCHCRRTSIKGAGTLKISFKDIGRAHMPV